MLTEQRLALAWFLGWLGGGAWGLTRLTYSWPELFGPLLPAAVLLWVGLLFGGQALLGRWLKRQTRPQKR